MHEYQEQCGSGCMAMCYIHLVQPAEVGFRPFGPRGNDQRTGHQHDVNRTDDLTRILACEFIATIVLGRENESIHQLSTGHMR